MFRWFKKLVKRCRGDLWVVRKCGFPYDRGYATYLPSKRTVLDTGLTKRQAYAICDDLNEEV